MTIINVRSLYYMSTYIRQVKLSCISWTCLVWTLYNYKRQTTRWNSNWTELGFVLLMIDIIISLKLSVWILHTT